MLEKDFLEKIDCKFPYNDINKGKEIIEESLLISDNAVFCIIDELTRIPKSKKKLVDSKNILNFLSYIDYRFKHKFKSIILLVSHKLLNKENISVSDILEYMDNLKKNKGLYGALNILYFSVDDINGEILLKGVEENFENKFLKTDLKAERYFNN
ncbi:MAG: hypothetical protein PHV23_00900 [Candidatus Gracilibacteria bacterium]|nr:hypothetical protein [Candidatus Gracilibacteria bacterium]